MRTQQQPRQNKLCPRPIRNAPTGPDAGETTQGIGIALNYGATKAQFDLW